MKTTLFLILTVSLLGSPAEAKEHAYERCTVVAMNAVPCGTQQKRHKKTRDLLCQEYVLRTDAMEYHVRQKEEKRMALLPIGEQGQFRIDKDRMKLRVPAGSGKEQEYLVVSAAHR